MTINLGVAGAGTDHLWKLWFHKVILSNSLEIGKYNEKIAGENQRISNKIGENLNFHIVNI